MYRKFVIEVNNKGIDCLYIEEFVVKGYRYYKGCEDKQRTQSRLTLVVASCLFNIEHLVSLRLHFVPSFRLLRVLFVYNIFTCYLSYLESQSFFIYILSPIFGIRASFKISLKLNFSLTLHLHIIYHCNCFRSLSSSSNSSLVTLPLQPSLS